MVSPTLPTTTARILFDGIARPPLPQSGRGRHRRGRAHLVRHLDRLGLSHRARRLERRGDRDHGRVPARHRVRPGWQPLRLRPAQYHGPAAAGRWHRLRAVRPAVGRPDADPQRRGRRRRGWLRLRFGQSRRWPRPRDLAVRHRGWRRRPVVRRQPRLGQRHGPDARPISHPRGGELGSLRHPHPDRVGRLRGGGADRTEGR